jgi:ESCRT-I complex subunit TSG101
VPICEQGRNDPSRTYIDPNRTYNDVAHLLSQYPHFAPRTDVYSSCAFVSVSIPIPELGLLTRTLHEPIAFENGVSALLLHLSGTLLVTFRGTVYRFPIAVWVPTRYPREPPLVYVTPTPDMLVRPGQHVSGDGRIYHHYLARWMEAYEVSVAI